MLEEMWFPVSKSLSFVLVKTNRKYITIEIYTIYFSLDLEMESYVNSEIHGLNIRKFLMPDFKKICN